MTEETENGRVVGADLEGQPVVEPFDRDTTPHHITFGGATGGSTFGLPHQRRMKVSEEDGEDVDRTFIEVGQDGEMAEIEDLEAVNPLAIPPESVAESGSQSTNGESNP